MKDLFSYPNVCGFKDGTTSKDAAIMMDKSGSASRWRKLCLIALEQGPATAKEICLRICGDLSKLDNVRPRLVKLRLDGLIVRTGDKRDGQHIVRLR